jgi:hypothetical protein
MINFIVYNLGSIPDWIAAIVSVCTLLGVWIAYQDYSQKTRPYVEVEIETEIDKESATWNLLAKVLNNGAYPVYVKVDKALLILGDEKYPTLVEKEFTISPKDDKIRIPVGYIYKVGRDRIKQAKYLKNTIELELEISSKKINDFNYKYTTYLKVQILVENDKPGFILLEKKFT